MGIRVVKYKKGDERKIANLCKKCILEINKKDLSKKQTELLIHEFSPRGIVRYARLAEVFVAKDKDKPIGTITLFNNQIKGMFVHPDYQLKGVGKQMLEHAEGEALKKGHVFTFLNSSSFSLKFYKKSGYRKVKVVDSIVGELTLMKKNLLN